MLANPLKKSMNREAAVDYRGAGCRRRGSEQGLPLLKYFVILLILLVGAAAVPMHASAAERYWVGGTGSWSDDDNHWATLSSL